MFDVKKMREAAETDSISAISKVDIIALLDRLELLEKRGIGGTVDIDGSILEVDAYDRCCELLEPHTMREAGEGGLPESVVESMEVLLAHWRDTLKRESELLEKWAREIDMRSEFERENGRPATSQGMGTAAILLRYEAQSLMRQHKAATP